MSPAKVGDGPGKTCVIVDVDAFDIENLYPGEQLRDSFFIRDSRKAPPQLHLHEGAKSG